MKVEFRTQRPQGRFPASTTRLIALRVKARAFKGVLKASWQISKPTLEASHV